MILHYVFDRKKCNEIYSITTVIHKIFKKLEFSKVLNKTEVDDA